MKDSKKSGEFWENACQTEKCGVACMLQEINGIPPATQVGPERAPLIEVIRDTFLRRLEVFFQSKSDIHTCRTYRFLAEQDDLNLIVI